MSNDLVLTFSIGEPKMEPDFLADFGGILVRESLTALVIVSVGLLAILRSLDKSKN